MNDNRASPHWNLIVEYDSRKARRYDVVCPCGLQRVELDGSEKERNGEEQQKRKEKQAKRDGLTASNRDRANRGKKGKEKDKDLKKKEVEE